MVQFVAAFKATGTGFLCSGVRTSPPNVNPRNIDPNTGAPVQSSRLVPELVRILGMVEGRPRFIRPEVFVPCLPLRSIGDGGRKENSRRLNEALGKEGAPYGSGRHFGMRWDVSRTQVDLLASARGSRRK